MEIVIAKAKRPTFESIYMAMAQLVAKRSTCSRLQVGCVITSLDYRYVYGLGYNGNASGLHNACDSKAPGACGCLHSEENAIINCRTSRAEAKVVFCTHMPCKMCAKRLLNLGGVKGVFYAEEYRLTEGIDLLQSAGVETVHWTQVNDPWEM